MEILQPTSFASGKRRPGKTRGASTRQELPGRNVNFRVVGNVMLGVLILGGLIYGAMNAGKVVDSVSNQRIEQVLIEGDINFLSEADVQRSVSSFISESLVTVDMAMIKQELEKMPWVRTVTIQREWPDTLKLNVVEEKAIARWGERQLLNQDGEIFSPENIVGLEQLAVLSGPVGTERQVMEQYQLFNQLLYQRGMRIADLSINSRGAWKLILANGVNIHVGKTQVMEKIRRLVEFADPLFVEKMVAIESIDLRYSNGIALKTKQNSGEEVVAL